MIAIKTMAKRGARYIFCNRGGVTKSVNTQEMTLRRDASDVEEAALDRESTATRGSLRDLESLEDSETEDFS